MGGDRLSDGETRIIDPETGGQKGSKLARFDLIPYDVLRELAEHFGRGALKYEDDNWRRGYSWRLSYAALMRHLTAWWEGEDIDEETGTSHLVAVAWHTFVLRWFQMHGKGRDDRPFKMLVLGEPPDVIYDPREDAKPLPPRDRPAPLDKLWDWDFPFSPVT